ncbi:hypothetical protein [Labilibaculum euxinus]
MNNNFFITKNYKTQFSAAGKAKIDCESTLERLGFKNLGLKRTTYSNSITGSILTFTGTILGLIRLKRNSVICIQYPIKKYYNLIVIIAKLKKCRVITVIHDLRSHRKGKVSIKKEISSLNRNNTIISHNQFMSKWLTDNSLTSKIINLEIFDYLGTSKKKESTVIKTDKYELVFCRCTYYKKKTALFMT